MTTRFEAYLQALPLLPVMATAGMLAAFLLAPVAMRLWRLPAFVAIAWSVAAAVPLAGLLTPLRWNGWPTNVTLAPLSQGLVGEPGWLSRAELLTVSEPSLNVWLFVPLGLCTVVAVGCGLRLGPVVAAFAVPVIGEIVQGVVPALDRVGMQWPDVSANWQGLVLGAVAGLPLAIGALAVRGTSSPSVSAANPGGIQTQATSRANRTDASISALRIDTDSTLKPNGMPMRRQ